MRLPRSAFLAFALLAPLDGLAQLAFIARCGEPAGIRLEEAQGEVRHQPDGFPGVNPTFIVTTEAPRRLTFLWGPAAWARDAQKLMENLRDADIIESTPERITAVRADVAGVSQMYTLYPTKGWFYFTQHRVGDAAQGGAPTASTFHAKCEYTN
jgi:hypothetical protein